MHSADYVIKGLSLSPHPEGGYFRRTFESNHATHSSDASRPLGTSIYYLLKKGEVSCLHSLDADETWYFHQGATLDLHLFEKDQYNNVKLGRYTPRADSLPQFTIPAGSIFGAVSNEHSKETYSLVSCSVCPGFQEEGFFWPDIAELRRKFKAHHELLGKLSKPVEY